MKILFLDRDGVINKDPDGYFNDKDNIEYNEDILEYIVENFKEYTIIIVTNQSGIARGYFNDLDFHILMNKMIEDLKIRDIYVEEYYYSPYLPSDNHWDRKPNPGMLERGLKKYNADPLNCIMIGDSESDYYASKNANLGRFIYYKEGVISESKC